MKCPYCYKEMIAIEYGDGETFPIDMFKKEVDGWKERACPNCGYFNITFTRLPNCDENDMSDKFEWYFGARPKEFHVNNEVQIAGWHLTEEDVDDRV